MHNEFLLNYIPKEVIDPYVIGHKGIGPYVAVYVDGRDSDSTMQYRPIVDGVIFK